MPKPFHPRPTDAQRHAMMSRAFGNSNLSAMDTYHALAQSYHMLTNLSERQMSRHNMSSAKVRLLFWLNMRYEEGTGGGGLLPSELSEFQGIMPNTVSSLLNSLRSAGLIEQANHPSDRRKHIIKITESGRALLREITPRYRDQITELFATLTEEEKQVLIKLLRKVINSISPLLCDPGDTKETTSEIAPEQG